MEPLESAREWALKIFRSEEAASRFLSEPNRYFGGKCPAQIARTHRGANWVIEHLTYLSYGSPILPRSVRGKAPHP